MKSVTSWLERKLYLKVSATKTKVVRPTKSNFLGFTFFKTTDKWQCKPMNDRMARLYDKCRQLLIRKRAVAIPTEILFIKLNQIIKGWINYFHIGKMKYKLDVFGQWLRHTGSLGQDADIIVKAVNIAIIMDHMPKGMVKMK